MGGEMLTLSGIRKTYGGRTLFTDAALQVNAGDRIGLVGPNGAGKSTLFRLILGEEAPDEGAISLPRGIRVGYLPQESVPAVEESVLELAIAVTPELVPLWRRLNGQPRSEDEHAPEVLEAQHRFDELDGHRVVAGARQVLSGLGFRERDFERPARTLSGGWVMRAHLARLLVQEPELLLLDEPTNHLDLEALLWFQERLKIHRGGILLISHDREFLNQLVGSVIEIRQSRLIRYRGNYEAFLLQSKAADEQVSAAYKNQQREIARLQRFVDRFRAKNTKAAQAQSKLKQIERMDKIEAPESAAATIGFRFPQPARSGQRVVSLRDVDFGYGESPVYQGLNFEVERGQRMVLVGPNGAGKSTLLKLLAGILQPQRGSRIQGFNVRTGYFSQYRTDILDEERTVLEEALASPQPVAEQSVRTVLGSFLFRGDDVFKRVKVLSGGEKSRLALVKLLLDPPNLMLLDEPTTHLDIPSTEALLEALRQFQGTILFISHDVFFIRSLANYVSHVRDGRITAYPGGYDYYVEKTGRPPAEAGGTRPTGALVASETRVVKPQDKREQRRREAEDRQQRSRQRRSLADEVHRLERAIHALEQRQTELTRALEDPSTYAQADRAAEITREFQETKRSLLPLTTEWEAAATRLAELDAAASSARS